LDFVHNDQGAVTQGGDLLPKKAGRLLELKLDLRIEQIDIRIRFEHPQQKTLAGHSWPKQECGAPQVLQLEGSLEDHELD
jgi:hypothetical protein